MRCALRPTCSLPAVAGWDEEWQLSDGRIWRRRKSELLSPEGDGKDRLLAKLHEIGSFNFNSQYLQGGFYPWTENEFKSGFFWERPTLPWTIETQIPGGGLYNVPYTDIVQHEVFGLDRSYPDLIDDLQMPLEIWEQQTIRHQEALLKPAQEDMARHFSDFEAPLP